MLDVAKNEFGCVKTIFLVFRERDPPAEVVNKRYAWQFVFPASRSKELKVNVTFVTWSPILPALIDAEALESKFVRNVILLVTGLLTNSRPESVRAIERGKPVTAATFKLDAQLS
jgi:hypothetical protein